MVPNGPEWTAVDVNQYDEDFEIRFAIYADEKHVLEVEAGTTAMVRGTKPDGNGYSEDCQIEIGQATEENPNPVSYVVVSGDKQMTAAAGRGEFEVTLYKDGRELNSANFALRIEHAALDRDTVASDSKIKEMLNVYDRADEIIAAGEQYESYEESLTTLTERAETAATGAESSAQSASQSAENISTQVAQDVTDFETWLAGVQEEIETKRQAIAGLTTTANQTATDAARTAGNTANELSDIKVFIDNLQRAVRSFELSREGHFADAFIEGGALYFTNERGETIAGPFEGIGGGGGGGGGGSQATSTVTLTNTSGWNTKSIAEGDQVTATLNWSSIENEMPTGNGTLRITVNNVVKGTLDVAQGTVNINLTPYLSSGTNVVRFTVYDIYENSRFTAMTVDVVAVSLASTFDSSQAYEGAINFPYIPYSSGNIAKTVHFLLDNREFTTENTSASGSTRTVTIPQQSHGVHTLDVYFDCEVNNQTVRSNTLHYEIICKEPLNTNPIVASDFSQTTAEQYETLNVVYSVYDPMRMEAPVTISVNGEPVQELTVDRTKHTFSYRVDSAGDLRITIASGNASKTIRLTVSESDIHPEAVKDRLTLLLSSAGRSNNENNPGVWEYGSGADKVSAVFEGFNFTRDGWIADDSGDVALRTLGGSKVTIPFQPYKNDFKTSGKTIEIEMASHNVLSYDVPIISCYDGERGFQIYADHAIFKSARSEVDPRYTTDTKIRMTLVVEPQSEYRLVWIYLNGVYAGVQQYEQNDSFRQTTAKGITIGNRFCGVDVYEVRVYDRNLTADEVTGNYIATRQNVAEMLSLYRANDIKDGYGNIVASKLASNLPYVTFTGPESPQYKGDKKTVTVELRDLLRDYLNFSATGVQADVQGTSSQYYYVKNIKIKLKNGVTVDGVLKVGFSVSENGIEVETFTLKADVASSEGANNIVIAKLFEDLSRYLNILTPPQKTDTRVRQGMDGFPMVVFWDYGDGPEFMGKYNFLNDKGTPEVFGFADGDEIWDVRSNTDQLSKFHTNVFGDAWSTEAYEPIYPEDYTDNTKLKEMTDFIYSTWQDEATDEALDAPVTYDGVTYSTDSAAYRLAKFKDGYPRLYDLDNAAFYYVYTLVLMMVDNRQKNEHLAYWGQTGKWWELIYDCDTALGTDNRGGLSFEYWVEDIDRINNEWVFNGADNVKWQNFRQAFWPECRAMYQRMRSSGMFDAASLKQRFRDWQALWVATIWNEDADRKYIEPLKKENITTYLPMAQGPKVFQREETIDWRIPYVDSLFDVGEALLSIMFRPYYEITEAQRLAGAVDLEVEVYKKCYVTVLFDDKRFNKRVIDDTYKCTVTNPLIYANDAVCAIHNAKMIKDVKGMENLHVGFWDSSNAPNLQAIRLGKDDANYTNTATKEVSVGANYKLTLVDMRGCVNFGTDVQKVLNLSHCPNIREVYMDRTAALAVTLPNGGVLETLHLPATVTSIVLRNHPKLTDQGLVVASYSNVNQCWMENMSGIDTLEILKALPANCAVRMTGFYWTAADADEIDEIFDILDTMHGLDINSEEVDQTQMSGEIHTDALTGNQIAAWKERYPSINVTADHTASYLTLMNYDGTSEKILCSDGVPTTTVPNPPARPSTDQYAYTPVGWSPYQDSEVADATCITNVSEDRTVYAAYSKTVRTYTVTWRNSNNNVLETDENVPYGTTPSYDGAVPQNPTSGGGSFTGWTPAISPVTGNVTYTASYIPTYTATFIRASADGGGTLYTQQNIPQGQTPVYEGEEPTSTQGADYTFKGWSPALSGITANTTYTAVFEAPKVWHDEEITDSWDTILSNIASGTFNYKPGNYKPLDLGAEGIVNMQIAGLNKDPLASGSGNAKTTWISKDLLTTSHNMNSSATTSGGWSATAMRTYLDDTIKPLIQENVRNAIKEVTKYSRLSDGTEQTTTDDVWIPSRREVGITSNAESSGPAYSEGYTDNASRIKKKVGASSGDYWWLRSADSTSNFGSVSNNGGNYSYAANRTFGVALGFCI